MHATFGAFFMFIRLISAHLLASSAEKGVEPFENEAESVTAARRWPTVEAGVPVFPDQVCHPGNAEIAEFITSAPYLGTQKVTSDVARALRKQNKNFLVLHYRLGIGIGYQSTRDGCNFSGNWIEIVSNGTWRDEWPLATAGGLQSACSPASCLASAPGSPGGVSNVTMCTWGWMLMDVANPKYTEWWARRVAAQILSNENDGLFADSTSVPSYLGFHPMPPLPEVNETFEAHWSQAIEAHLRRTRAEFEQALPRPRGAVYYPLVPNVGAWVTSRSKTDYSVADGVLVEGCCRHTLDSFGWTGGLALQLARVVPLATAGKVVMMYDGEAPAAGAAHRLYTLAVFLLVRGNHTYLSYGAGCTWFPEFALDRTSVAAAAGSSMLPAYNASVPFLGSFTNAEGTLNGYLLPGALGQAGVYARRYQAGVVLLRAGSPSKTPADVAAGSPSKTPAAAAAAAGSSGASGSSDSPVQVPLQQAGQELALPAGQGGAVSNAGTVPRSWTEVAWGEAVQSVSLAPGEVAVVRYSQ